MHVVRSRGWWPTRLALVCGTASTVACSESTTPAPAPTGRYELAFVNDQPPPYPFYSSLMFQRNLVSGSIEFRGRGRLVEARGYQNLSYGGEPVAEVETDTLAQVYRVRARSSSSSARPRGARSRTPTRERWTPSDSRSRCATSGPSIRRSICGSYS